MYKRLSSGGLFHLHHMQRSAPCSRTTALSEHVDAEGRDTVVETTSDTQRHRDNMVSVLQPVNSAAAPNTHFPVVGRSAQM